MNLLIGTVLFVVVMIVLITNSQSVSDLKKSIKTSSVETSVSTNQSAILVRDKEGFYAPKRLYYLSPTTDTNAPAKPAGVIDQLIFAFDEFTHSGARDLARDITEGRCKVVYRPETRVLYKIVSFAVYTGSAWPNVTDITTNGLAPSSWGTSTSGTFLVNLVRNMESITSENPMFTESEKDSGKMRTVIGVPCEMTGNMASGI